MTTINYCLKGDDSDVAVGRDEETGATFCDGCDLQGGTASFADPGEAVHHVLLHLRRGDRVLNGLLLQLIHDALEFEAAAKSASLPPNDTPTARSRVVRYTATVHIDLPNTDVTLHHLTPGASCRLLSLTLWNHSDAVARVLIGKTAAGLFWQLLPVLMVPSLSGLVLEEGFFYLFGQDIVVQSDQRPVEAVARVEEHGPSAVGAALLPTVTRRGQHYVGSAIG